MNGKKKGGVLLIAAGLLCIAAALALVGYNLAEAYRAGKSAAGALTQLEQQTPSAAPADSAGQEEPPDYILNPDMEMPVATIDGNAYIGILQLPSLDLELPILSEWSYPQLKIAPCRYSGSAYAGNFTIAGHNYSTHFGPIGDLAAGDPVVFTDVEGRCFSYEVQTVETLEATAIEEMVSSEWDLTLFTCTSSGQARVTVRCLRAD